MTENITMILLFLLTGCFRTSLFSSEEAGGIVTNLSLSLNCLLPTVCPSEWSYFNLSCYRTYRLNRVPSVEEADSLCRQTSARRCLYRSSVSTRPAVELGSVLLELIVSWECWRRTAACPPSTPCRSWSSYSSSVTRPAGSGEAKESIWEDTSGLAFSSTGLTGLPQTSRFGRDFPLLWRVRLSLHASHSSPTSTGDQLPVRCVCRVTCKLSVQYLTLKSFRRSIWWAMTW